MTAAQVRFAVYRLNAHHPHQARYALALDTVTGARKDNRDFPRPVKKPFQMQPVDPSYQIKIDSFHWRGLAIDRRTRQAQQFALPRDRRVFAIGFNLLDPLRSAYFLSTFNKKSRSTISCSIVSCSFAILPSSVLA